MRAHISRVANGEGVAYLKMMVPLFSIRRLLLASSLLVAASVGGSACTRNVGLVLAVDSNVSVPDNIDEVAVVLSDANGNVFYSNTWRARGSNPITLPAQMGVAPADSTIHIAVVGFQNGAPKIFREAIGRSPSDVLAALQMGLDWEDWGSAQAEGATNATDGGAPNDAGADGGSVALAFDPGMVLLDTKNTTGHTVISVNGKRIINTCDRGKTSVGGRCIDARFDPSKLPVYSEDLVYGGANRECFPRVACFPQRTQSTHTFLAENLKNRKALMRSSTGDCIVDLTKLPDGFALGSKFNVGVQVPKSPRVIVINKATRPNEGGWSRVDENTLLVPDALCDGSSFGEAAKTLAPVLVFSTACESKTRANPLCENTASGTKALGGVSDPKDEILPDASVVIPNPLDGGLWPLLDAGALLDAGVLPDVAFAPFSFPALDSPQSGPVVAVDLAASANSVGGTATTAPPGSLVAAVSRNVSSGGTTALAATVYASSTAWQTLPIETRWLPVAGATPVEPARLFSSSAATGFGVLNTTQQAITTLTSGAPASSSCSVSSDFAGYRGVTMQPNGSLFCLTSTANQPWDGTFEGAPHSAMVPAADASRWGLPIGGFLDIAALPNNITPLLWVGQNAASVAATPPLDGSELFASLEIYNHVLSDPARRDALALSLIPSAVTGTAPSWELRRFHVRTTDATDLTPAGWALVSMDLALDPLVTESTSGALLVADPGHHPYAVSGPHVYFLTRGRSGALVLHQYDLDKAPGDPMIDVQRTVSGLPELLPSKHSTQVFSFGVTQTPRTTEGGGPINHVYLAAAGGAKEAPHLWVAHLELPPL